MHFLLVLLLHSSCGKKMHVFLYQSPTYRHLTPFKFPQRVTKLSSWQIEHQEKSMVMNHECHSYLIHISILPTTRSPLVWDKKGAINTYTSTEEMICGQPAGHWHGRVSRCQVDITHYPEGTSYRSKAKELNPKSA